MPFFLRVCVFIFSALVPTLAHPQSGVLEIPSNGTQLSGVGVISGWKCDAGTITVSLNGGARLPTVKGLPRNDTRGACRNSGYNGFVTYMNWAILGDGEHTAVAFDNGVEFARSTFEVATLGEEFVARASLWLRVPNFPSPGEETYFEWNQSTQHLEVVRSQDISDICLSQPSPATLGPAPAPTPLLLPPPLPCPPDQGGDFNGTYLIQFQHDYAELATYTCTAVRGTTQVTIQDGRISGVTRAPPHGRFRTSGEVCAQNGFYVGQWSLDGRFAGVFTGSLGTESCPGIWEDTAGCAGSFNIFQLP